MQPSHVLVPLDGSAHSSGALSHALDVFDCRVTVLNVVTPIDTAMSEGGVLETDDERQRAAHARAGTVIDDARVQASESDRTVETVVIEGEPAATIVEYATNQNVDQIVMGGHGSDSSGLTKRMLGTVATTVVSDSPTTVTVVR